MKDKKLPVSLPDAARKMCDALYRYTTGQGLTQTEAREAIDAYWSAVPNGEGWPNGRLGDD